MQPVGPKITIEAIEKSQLEKVPMEIKLQVLKCLNIPEIASTAVFNKIWQKMASDNRVWKQVALQLNIKGDLTNAKQEVMDHLKYHSTVEVVEDFLKTHPNVASAEVNKAQKESENKKVKEKYQTILQSFISGSAGEFSDFMIQIFSTKPLLPKHIQVLKQLIEDGVITEERLDPRDFIVSDNHIEIVQCLINKFKHRKDILSKATGLFANSLNHNKATLLKLLCISGVRPNASHFVAAAKSKYYNEHLQVLLDYSDETVRKDAIDKIKDKLQDLSEKEKLIYPMSAWKESYAITIEIIQKAPPPTYGGQTCNQ